MAAEIAHLRKEKRAMSRILLVDDEPNIVKILTVCLTQSGHAVTGAASAEEALSRLEATEFDLLISDVRLGSGMDGLGLLQASLSRRPELPVILITAYGTVELAVEAMKLGASDFIRKPFKLDELRHTVANSLARRSKMAAAVSPPALTEAAGGVPLHFGLMVGESAEMLLLYERIEKVAKSDASVLIQGESGTGKELVAQAIHRLSPRAAKPCVALNCAALPANLLESEMFGHAAGAFTGASHRKDGLFQAADGGTLLLDEISTMDAGLQSKLLRVLQERRVRRVGETTDMAVDVRVIAATNESLEETKEMGAFREDLFYRISVIPVELPPLRRHSGDIPLLVEHFLRLQAKAMGGELRLDDGVLGMLMRYSWPGNIRELGNAVACAATLCRDGLIRVEDLPPRISRRPAGPAVSPAGPAERFSVTGTPPPLRDFLRDKEREYMDMIIQHTGGNRVKAAEMLGISRATLYRKLEGDTSVPPPSSPPECASTPSRLRGTTETESLPTG